MDVGAWQATVHGVTERRTRLSNLAEHIAQVSGGVTGAEPHQETGARERGDQRCLCTHTPRPARPRDRSVTKNLTCMQHPDLGRTGSRWRNMYVV